jgi:hypothetical protein
VVKAMKKAGHKVRCYFLCETSWTTV